MSSDRFPTEIMNISNKKQTVPKSRSLLINNISNANGYNIPKEIRFL